MGEYHDPCRRQAALGSHASFCRHVCATDAAISDLAIQVHGANTANTRWLPHATSAGDEVTTGGVCHREQRIPDEEGKARDHGELCSCCGPRSSCRRYEGSCCAC